MNPNPNPQSRGQSSVRIRSLASLCATLAVALVLNLTSAQAQDTAAQNPPPSPAPKPADQTAPKEAPIVMAPVFVTGVRASLISAEEIKLNSPEFVDSIVAEDIGKLPDITVADALQRVPGVQVGRANGEVSSVVIRGLPNLETTLNGYEVFTGVTRGVALQDIPAELVAGVDVYKTASPDKIEGGVAGLIDVRLRRPFDFTGLTVAGTGSLRSAGASKSALESTSAFAQPRLTKPIFGAAGEFFLGDFITRCAQMKSAPHGAPLI